MRYFRIFIMHFEHLLEHRSKSFVWFLIALLNPLIVLAFWRGALTSNNIAGITFSSIASYYFLLIVAGSVLMPHVEQDVAFEDIHMGQLTTYLIKPFSYFWINLIEETPYRLLQGGYGMLVFGVLLLFFHNLFKIATDPAVLALTALIAILAFLIGFVFKMVVGFMAFWITDIGGIYGLIDLILLIFAGYIMPLELFPTWLKNITDALPFSYIIYYPIVALQGKLPVLKLFHVIGIQLMWLAALGILYNVMWKRGIRKYTAIGQ